MNDEDEIVIDEELQEFFANCKLSDIVFTPDYLPYSYRRIREIFLSIGIELRPYYNWYKAMSYRSTQKYMLVDMYTNEIIGDERGYYLYSLRCFLAKQRFPLHSNNASPKKAYRKNTDIPKRREGCIRFLQALDSLERNESDE